MVFGHQQMLESCFLVEVLFSYLRELFSRSRTIFGNHGGTRELFPGEVPLSATRGH